MPRYVILRHEPQRPDNRPLHWDLMLEDGPALLTWALASEPSRADPIAAELLPIHRLSYLDYEGLVSEARGYVTRWDAGTFEWIHREEGEIRIAIQGQHRRGTVLLKRLPQDQRWEVSWAVE